MSLEKACGIAHLIWWCGLAFALPVWIGLPLLIPREPSQDDYLRLVTVLFFVVSLVDLGMGWWFKTRALNPRTYGSLRALDEAFGYIFGQSLIVVVLSSSPVVFALLIYILSANLLALSGLCALSIAGLLLLRPRLEEWQDTLRGIHIDANRSA